MGQFYYGANNVSPANHKDRAPPGVGRAYMPRLLAGPHPRDLAEGGLRQGWFLTSELPLSDVPNGCSVRHGRTRQAKRRYYIALLSAEARELLTRDSARIEHRGYGGRIDFLRRRQLVDRGEIARLERLPPPATACREGQTQATASLSTVC